MLTQHNRETARLSPDYTLAIRELGVWSGDETTTELAQIWRQDTDTINDQQSYQKIYMRSAIMGRNGRVVLGAYFQMVFSTDSAHFLYPKSFCLDLILLCNLLQCCGTIHKCQQRLGFSLFSGVRKVENIISGPYVMQ